MFEIASVSMLLISAVAIAVFGIITALRIRRLMAHAAGLRSHPMLDPEWLARKRVVVQSLTEGLQNISSGTADLRTALDALAQDVADLSSAVALTAGAVDQILCTTAPWMRGLLAVRRFGH
jgi:hypothetical protein